MAELKTGDTAPDFSMPATSGKTVNLADYKGKKLVVYFYPKDDTSGCTAQACDFRDSIAPFNAASIDVIGVSKDNVKSHEKFKANYDLNFELASDETGEVCEKYGVWAEKSMYGRKYMGIERTTFLIDENGKIAGVWNKVKVPGHVAEVLAAINGTGSLAA